MLETYDPDWQAKFDRAQAMMRELEVRDWLSLTADDRDRLGKLRKLLPVICDAKHRTPNEYIRLHLSPVIVQAARESLVIDYPRLPDDAGIDATRAVVAETMKLVERYKGVAQAEAELSEVELARARLVAHRSWLSRWWVALRSGR